MTRAVLCCVSHTVQGKLFSHGKKKVSISLLLVGYYSIYSSRMFVQLNIFQECYKLVLQQHPSPSFYLIRFIPLESVKGMQSPKDFIFVSHNLERIR